MTGRSGRRTLVALTLVGPLLLAACGGSPDDSATSSPTTGGASSSGAPSPSEAGTGVPGTPNANDAVVEAAAARAALTKAQDRARRAPAIGFDYRLYVRGVAKPVVAARGSYTPTGGPGGKPAWQATQTTTSLDGSGSPTKTLIRSIGNDYWTRVPGGAKECWVSSQIQSTTPPYVDALLGLQTDGYYAGSKQGDSYAAATGQLSLYSAVQLLPTATVRQVATPRPDRTGLPVPLQIALDTRGDISGVALTGSSILATLKQAGTQQGSAVTSVLPNLQLVVDFSRPATPELTAPPAASTFTPDQTQQLAACSAS